MDKWVGSAAVDLKMCGARVMLENTLAGLKDLEWRFEIEHSRGLPIEHIRCSLNDFRPQICGQIGVNSNRSSIGDD